MTSWMRSSPTAPGMPISVQRSFVPTRIESTPGTAAIASTFSTAVGVSIITTTRVEWFTARVTSAWGCASKPTCGSRPVTERRPTGGYLQLLTISAATSGVSTWGTTTPCAPPSRARLAWKCWNPGTRTIGAMPASWAATLIWAAVSMDMELCSMSMNSQS